MRSQAVLCAQGPAPAEGLPHIPARLASRMVFPGGRSTASMGKAAALEAGQRSNGTHNTTPAPAPNSHLAKDSTQQAPKKVCPAICLTQCCPRILVLRTPHDPEGSKMHLQ